MDKEQLRLKLGAYSQAQTLLERSPVTIKKYQRDITYFIDFLPNNEEIQKHHVLAYKDSLCQGQYKTSSINNFITIVNTFLKWCELSDHRVREIKTQQKSSLPNVVSESDVSRLLRHAKKLDKIELYHIIKIITTCGIRISELESFTVSNIQGFTFTTYNKGKEREIILTQELARELRKYCKDRKLTEGKIFRISYSTIYRHMKQVASAAKVNLERVHPHSFRHFFAKEFMNQYNNVLDLADILGHSSLETTRIYTRSTLEEKRRKLENMKGRKRDAR